jgi:hypothetical protein
LRRRGLTCSTKPEQIALASASTRELRSEPADGDSVRCACEAPNVTAARKLEPVAAIPSGRAPIPARGNAAEAEQAWAARAAELTAETGGPADEILSNDSIRSFEMTMTEDDLAEGRLEALIHRTLGGTEAELRAWREGTHPLHPAQQTKRSIFGGDRERSCTPGRTGPIRSIRA